MRVLRTPPPRRPFVGRDADLERLAPLVDGPGLVTVIGPPGVGKTRLATEALARFAAGRSAVHVAMDRVGETRALCRSVAHALSLRNPTASRPDKLGEHLAGAFVLLDGVGDLEDEARQVLADWVARGVVLLVTAREPLRVPDERRFVLPPLARTPEDAALALLCELLRGSTIDVEDADVRMKLSRIVTSTDGLPLALELLAPQIVSGGVDLVLERVKRDGDALVDLRAVLESLWTALGPAEQRGLARLSVFRGAFDLEGARAVLATDDALEVVYSLCERSALSVVTPGDGPRFKLLVPLRTFAEEKLAALGESHEQDAWRQHARTLAARTHARPEDWDDLVACIDRCLTSADAAEVSLAITAAALLEPVLAASGTAAEQLELAERVTSRCEVIAGPADRARALISRGDARRRAGRIDDAQADFDGALAAARSLEDDELLARAEKGIGAVWFVRGRNAEADAALTRALAHADRAGHDELRGIVRSDLGATALALGEPARARELLERALDLLEPTGNVLHRAGASANLGVASLEMGDLVAAQRCFEQAAALSAGTMAVVHGFALANLGLVAHFGSRLDEAREHYTRALAVARRADSALFVGTFGGYLAIVSLEQRAVDDAHARIVDAIGHLTAAGEHRYQALWLAVKACTDWWLGRPDSARDALESARRAVPAGDTEIGDATEALAAQLFDAGLASSARASRPPARPASPSNERKLAARVAAAVAREAARRGVGTLTLRVHRDGAWFQVDREKLVSLERFRTLRRLLVALSRAHEESLVVTRETLVEHVWPDERVLEAAARNRLKVALSQLRRLGLAEVIETAPTGYRLTPRCRVVLVEDREDAAH